MDVDPSTLDERQRQEAGVGLFPADLTAALEVLEQDAGARALLGDLLHEGYVYVRRKNWDLHGEAPDDDVMGTWWRS